MYSEDLYRIVRGEVEPVVRAAGFLLVELSVGRRKGSTRVCLVVYRAEGVGVENCAEISRLVFPRLQTIEGFGDVELEVGSPGIERTLKRAEEYAIFQGRGVRILEGNGSEWIGGVIEKAENGMLALRNGSSVKEYPFSSIRKARLDYSEEKRAGISRESPRAPGGPPEARGT